MQLNMTRTKQVGVKDDDCVWTFKITSSTQGLGNMTEHPLFVEVTRCSGSVGEMQNHKHRKNKV